MKEEKYGITKFGTGIANTNSNILDMSNKHLNKISKSNDNEIMSSNINPSISPRGDSTSNFSQIDYQLSPIDKIQSRHFDIKYDFLTENYYILNYKNSALFVRLSQKQVSLVVKSNII